MSSMSSMHGKHRHHPYLSRVLTPPLITHLSNQPPSNYFTQPTSIHLNHSPLQHHQTNLLSRHGLPSPTHVDPYALSAPAENDSRMALRMQSDLQQQQQQQQQQQGRLELQQDQQHQGQIYQTQILIQKPEPLLRKGRWSPGEDGRLLSCIDVYGPNKWKQVAREVGTRTGDQCWKRWNDSLDPTLKHDSWTQEEDEILQTSVAQMGRCWSKIATEKLNGRSGLACKNRMDHLNRKRRRAMTVPGQLLPRRTRLSRAEINASQMDQLTSNLLHSEAMRRDPMHPLSLLDNQTSFVQNDKNSFETLNAPHRSTMQYENSSFDNVSATNQKNFEYLFPNKINDLDFGHRNLLASNPTPASSPIWWNGNSNGNKEVGRNCIPRQSVPMQNNNNGLWNVPSAYNVPNFHLFTPNMSYSTEMAANNPSPTDISSLIHPFNQGFTQNTNVNANNGYQLHGFPNYPSTVPNNTCDCRSHAPGYSSSYPSSQHSTASISSPQSEVSSSSMNIHNFASPHPLNIASLTAPTNVVSAMPPLKSSLQYTLNQDEINAAYYSSSSPHSTGMTTYCTPHQLTSTSNRYNNSSFVQDHQANLQVQMQESESAEVAQITSGSMIESHLNINNTFESIHDDPDSKDTNASWYPATEEGA